MAAELHMFFVRGTVLFSHIKYMKQQRGFKYRIYPDRQQQVFFQKTFGCCRFVYNKVLEEQERLYAAGLPHMSGFTAFQWMTATLKAAFPFLREADSTALMNAVFHLDEAYSRFFHKTAKFPQFKKKHGRSSYTASCVSRSIHYGEDYIILPKVGMVKAAMHRLPQEGWMVKSATVSQNSKGDYYCSLLCEKETEEVHISTTKADKVLGLDYKSSGLYMDSNGCCADMPKFFASMQKKLTRAQRRLANKKGSSKFERKSKNYKKQQQKVNQLHVKIASQRKDFLHKLSAAIAKQYDFVAVEGIDMTGIASSDSLYHLGKATCDNGFGMFRTMLAYKLADKGGMLIVTDKYFPSSQRCSHCGYIHEEVKDLSVRKWECPHCHTVHDRDHNAAINEKHEGVRLLKEKGIAVSGDSGWGWDSPVLPADFGQACGSEVVA